MVDIKDAQDVATCHLDELRRLSHETIHGLDDNSCDIWANARMEALKRADANEIGSLIREFEAPFCGHAGNLQYEPAFVFDWRSNLEPLYNARWWINEWRAGVYFIYDNAHRLRYVGSACGGALGNRIYSKYHEACRNAVDVVLFDRPWIHFALALEVLVISRLEPPENGSSKNLSIPAVAPFDRIW